MDALRCGFGYVHQVPSLPPPPPPPPLPLPLPGAYPYDCPVSPLSTETHVVINLSTRQVPSLFARTVLGPSMKQVLTMRKRRPPRKEEHAHETPVLLNYQHHHHPPKGLDQDTGHHHDPPRSPPRIPPRSPPRPPAQKSQPDPLYPPIRRSWRKGSTRDDSAPRLRPFSASVSPTASLSDHRRYLWAPVPPLTDDVAGLSRVLHETLSFAQYHLQDGQVLCIVCDDGRDVAICVAAAVTLLHPDLLATFHGIHDNARDDDNNHDNDVILDEDPCVHSDRNDHNRDGVLSSSVSHSTTIASVPDLDRGPVRISSSSSSTTTTGDLFLSRAEAWAAVGGVRSALRRAIARISAATPGVTMVAEATIKQIRTYFCPPVYPHARKT